MTEETRNENVETNEQPTEQRQEAPKEQPKQESKDTDNREDYVSKDELQAAQDRIHQLNKENQKRREQIKEWESLKEKGYDPEKLSALVEQQKELERKQMEEQGRYQELIEEMKSEREQELDRIRQEKEQETTALRSSLEKYLVDSKVTSALAKEGVEDSRILNKEVKARMKVIDDNGEYKVVIVDEKGEPKLKRGGAPYTEADLIAEMKEDKEFSRLFPAPNVTGAGTKANSQPASKAPMGINRSKMTAKQKADFQREHGFDAYWELPL